MQRIFAFIIFTLLLQSSFGQNVSRLAYSDSLYARGVALYNAKEYDAAILLFEQSKAIETEELDSLDSRVIYLRNWIASCYFKKGDLKNAALYDERGYDLPPIDRRLMVKSDSISKVVLAYKGDDTNFIIQKLQEMYQIEYAALGRESRWTINTRMYIAELTAYSGDFQKAKADVKRVLDDCDNLYGKNARFKRFLLEQAINVYSMKGELYDVLEGFNDFLLYLDAVGEAESELAVNVWDNLSKVFAQVGMMDKYNEAVEKMLSIASKLYGTTGERYILQLLSASEVNCSMGNDVLALKYITSAEELSVLYGGKYCEPHLLALLQKSIVYFKQNKVDETKKLLKKIVRKADVKKSEGQIVLSGSSSLLLMISSMNGKIDNDLIDEVYEIRRKLANAGSIVDDLYSIISVSLSVAHINSNDYERALKIADEDAIKFENSNLYVPLLCCSYVYLIADYYVKARKTSGAALNILNTKLDRKYAAQEVAKGQSHIDNSLSIVEMKLRDSEYSVSAYDTVRYSLSMIKQNLLQSKLILLEHLDSLGTPYFYDNLKKFALVAMQETKDELMADSVMNKYCNRVKEKFGEHSPQYQKYSELEDVVRFEMDASNYQVVWDVERYATTTYMDSLERDSAYKKALAEYDKQFELWKNNKSKPKESKYYTKYNAPSLWQVLRDRNFLDAFCRYKEFFDSIPISIFTNIITNDKHSMAINMGLCADSLGLREAFMEKMKCWKDSIIKENVRDVVYWAKYLSVIRLHTDSITYELHEKDVLRYVDSNDALKLPIVATLCVIDNLLDNYTLKSVYNKELTSSFNRLDYFLSLLKDSKKKKEIYTAVLYAKCLISYHSIHLSCNRLYLLDDFKIIYQLLSENPELHRYQESYDAMNMLCALAYEKQDYKLVVDADRLRQQIKKVVLQNNDNEYYYSAFVYLSELIYDLIGYRYSIEHISEDEMKYLETKVSLAYHYSKEEKTNEEKYDYLVASWNEIRKMQRQRLFSDKNLEDRIGALSSDIINALGYGPNSSDTIRELAYDFALFSKGYMLRSEQELVKVLKESGNRTVQKQYEDYLRIKRQLDDTTLPPTELQQLKMEADKIMTELWYSSKAFDDYTKSLEVGWRDVQNALDDDEMAIEYINKGDWYYALILKKNYDAPLLVNMYRIDDVIKESSDSLYLKYTHDIWPYYIVNNGEIEYLLDGVKSIYFSPTGMLYQVAMENMLAEGGGSNTLMCEKYNLYRVSNTMEIVKHKNKLKRAAPLVTKAALYGGIEYYVKDDVWAEIASKNQHEGEENVYAMRDVSAFERGAAFYLEPLPGTNKEVEQIAEIFSENNLSVETYTTINATEDEFKRTSGSDVTMLHVATHGFYQTQDEIKDSTSVTLIRQDDSKEDQSLSRSGLFMTGASAWFYGEAIPDNVDDGILTAREISHLDLTNVNMVVLSACETGLGEITGEGVFGLQRGFKKAGIQSMIMSLWKVNDQATRILMTEFYRNLITNKQTKRVALVNARNYLRTCENGRFAHPRYWAAFILLDGID